MSQFYVNSSGALPPPPIVPTSFVEDTGSATPAANILNILGSDTNTNNDNGIATSGAGNTVTILLTNRQTDTVSTSDDTLTNILTLALGSAGTYYVWGSVQAYNASGPNSGVYSFSGGYRTDGVTAIELGTEYHDTFEDPGFATADIFLIASGNDVILQVQGVDPLSINWNSVIEYRQVN